MKIDSIEIEGVDKTGKDVIRKYIDVITNYRYCCKARGLISNTVYEIINGRQGYNRHLNNHTLYVLLTADHEDLEIRHKITNEPYIPIQYHSETFSMVFNNMTDGLHHLQVNTSVLTPYEAAKMIVGCADMLNGYKN